MIEEKNILIMPWGLDLDGNYFSRQKMDFPKETKVLIDFDKKRVTGRAFNFKNKPKGIYCDVKLDEKVTNTLTLGGKILEHIHIGDYSKIIKFELINCSLIPEGNHSNNECNGNLEVKK